MTAQGQRREHSRSFQEERSWAHQEECVICLRGLGVESLMFGKPQNSYDSLSSPVQKIILGTLVKLKCNDLYKGALFPET